MFISCFISVFSCSFLIIYLIPISEIHSASPFPFPLSLFLFGLPAETPYYWQTSPVQSHLYWAGWQILYKYRIKLVEIVFHDILFILLTFNLNFLVGLKTQIFPFPIFWLFPFPFIKCSVHVSSWLFQNQNNICKRWKSVNIYFRTNNPNKEGHICIYLWRIFCILCFWKILMYTCSKYF